MTVLIKDVEVDGLVRGPAGRTGETISVAVNFIPTVDRCAPDEILGDDELGVFD